MDNIILTALNFNKVCRVCLIENDSMFSIYSELFEDNSDEKIPHIFEILVNISSIKVETDDGLPSMICTKCIDKAHSSYKFQQQCNRSQALLDAYIEQIKELVKDEEISEQLGLEKYDLKTDMIENREDANEDDLLSTKYALINDVDLHKSANDDTKSICNDDCDDLKNCLPLGEDTVDLLIKDNLQVDNLELISPKLRSFNFSLKAKEPAEPKVAKAKNSEKQPKDPPNMNYYRKEKDNGSFEYECNICEKKFKFGNSLRIHLKNHDEQKPYVCTICKKGFKVYGSLMHHTRSHSGEQPYECKVCGKKYKQSGTLTAHMRIHTECDKAFPSSTRLKRHSIIHTTLKPYKCHICEKSFNRSSSLRVHTKTHLGVRSHVCSMCGKAFLWAHSLRGHMLTHSKESVEKKPEVGNTVVSTPDSTTSSTVTATGSETISTTSSESSLIEKSTDSNTMTIYSDSPVNKMIDNKCFAIYSKQSASIDSALDEFQIYSIGHEGVETFTLYSAETNAEHTSTVNSSAIQLSAVTL
ncbi:hypothetical protein NQ318_000177 [Aromia moschata]|uniref:Uncharacterized protein n=1 Tax=Aromia moschata TaxID=1265417 RepID=A0AAV8YJY7_9CUCU|nr:hypothetical protein NQ318_000177 [Aromia moschata]